MIYPLLMTNSLLLKIAHWNSEFSHWEWRFSMVMFVYQRVIYIHSSGYRLFDIKSSFSCPGIIFRSVSTSSPCGGPLHFQTFSELPIPDPDTQTQSYISTSLFTFMYPDCVMLFSTVHQSICWNSQGLVNVQVKHHPTNLGIFHFQQIYETDLQNPQLLGHLPSPDSVGDFCCSIPASEVDLSDVDIQVWALSWIEASWFRPEWPDVALNGDDHRQDLQFGVKSSNFIRPGFEIASWDAAAVEWRSQLGSFLKVMVVKVRVFSHQIYHHVILCLHIKGAIYYMEVSFVMGIPLNHAL